MMLIPNLICDGIAVGENYNSTYDKKENVMGKTLIIITGYSAAGKSSFSRYIKSKTSVSIITFRESARELATLYSYKYIRDFYDSENDAVKITDSYIYSKIVESYQKVDILIYEGVLSRNIVLKFKEDSRYNLFLCFLDVPYNIRKKRLLRREQIDEEKTKEELIREHW